MINIKTLSELEIGDWYLMSGLKDSLWIVRNDGARGLISRQEIEDAFLKAIKELFDNNYSVIEVDSLFINPEKE